MDKEQELEKVKAECLEFCQYQALATEGSQMVFGEGPIDAKIMMIGEAPGYNESVTGRPFCGAAGEVLGELLSQSGLKREKIYITNLLKLRPPKNRDPEASEIQEFSPFLDAQINIIQPQILCPLGNFASRYILKRYNLEHYLIEDGKRIGISHLHGKVFKSESLLGTIVIMPLYHPAVVTYNANMKETLMEDFIKLKKVINQN